MFSFILTLTTLLSAISAYAQPAGKLKIVRGDTDTAYTSPHILVGVTAPGNTVTLNGEKVHVYTTGSFGKEIPLTPGNNEIIIRTFPGNDVSVLHIFYDTSGKRVPALPAQAARPGITPADLPLLTTEGAYLNYGNGTDRLGGAKINFLDKGIRLQAIGETESLYQVRLSDNRYAFIPKALVEVTGNTAGTNVVPATLSGSWSVSNAGGYDRVKISLDEKRPYIIQHEVNPGKIVVDLFGVHCNSNWITQYLNLESIENVDVSGTDSDVMRVTVNLRHQTYWGYRVKYEGNALVIDVKHAPQPALKNLTIGVDAGHGGAGGNGAVSAAGYKEKDQNLAMALILKELLEKKGATVFLSRDGDYEKNNQLRVKEFKEKNIDLLISIHCNAGGNPLKTGGASTYYHHIEHRELARHILARVLELKGVQNFGLVGNFNFTLNSPTDFPSVLVETLFMSNLWDEEHITDPVFQRKMMRQVVKGVEDYLKYCRQSRIRYRY